MPLTTYVAGDVLTAASLNDNFTFAASSGGVVQVQSQIKTTSFSTSSMTFVDVTDVTISITPTSASNKILVFVAGLAANASATETTRLNLVRDSTAIAQSTGGTTPQTIGLFTASTASGSGFAITFLDSPATTSATTYKLQIASGAATNALVGRFANSDSRRSVTTITVMEVTP